MKSVVYWPHTGNGCSIRAATDKTFKVLGVPAGFLPLPHLDFKKTTIIKAEAISPVMFAPQVRSFSVNKLHSGSA